MCVNENVSVVYVERKWGGGLITISMNWRCIRTVIHRMTHFMNHGFAKRQHSFDSQNKPLDGIPVMNIRKHEKALKLGCAGRRERLRGSEREWKSFKNYKNGIKSFPTNAVHPPPLWHPDAGHTSSNNNNENDCTNEIIHIEMNERSKLFRM